MNPDSVCNTCTRSRLGIQSTESGVKVIGFTNSKRGQIGEPVGNEEFMAYLADTPIVLNDNSLLFKDNVEYVWAKFI